MKLSELKRFGKLINHGKDPEIQGISYDSRKVKPGDLFIALVGRKFDGHNFLKEAGEKGAVAALVSRIVKTDLPILIVENTRISMAKIAAHFFDHPSEKLKVTGITGTNGKSTTAFVLNEIFKHAGLKGSMIGTIHYEIARKIMRGERTTPESPDIQKLMAETLESGGEYFVMEVSSQSVCEHRVDEVRFRNVVFTNLSREHLEYHGTFENYMNAKLKFFTRALMSGARGFVNADDIHSRLFISVPGKIITLSLEREADFRGIPERLSIRGTVFTVRYRDKTFRVEMNLIGEHNVYNALTAFAVAYSEGISPETITQAIKSIKSIPGRLERISSGGINIFIDYAHTPKALEKVLATLKPLTHGRLITVFGAGGERDHGKRHLMGAVASRYSDFIILTSDNPRGEDPLKIIMDIRGGVSVNHEWIVDRKEAIERAVNLAGPGDTILIAGKGHEDYQEIRGKKIHFSDKEVVYEILSG